MSSDKSTDQGSRQPDFDSIRWTAADLDDYRQLYWDEIAPVLDEQGIDPITEKPTSRWLRDNNCRSFVEALSRHQDRTFGEFWAEDLEQTASDDDSGYPWHTDHTETIDALERFLENREERFGIAESSIDALRTRLNRYVHAYKEANGEGDLLTAVSRDSDRPEYEAVDACYNSFDWLNTPDSPVYNARTLRRTKNIVQAWYEHLLQRRVAAFNPASGLDTEFRWEVEDSPTPSLTADHISQLIRVAETPEQNLLVVALAGWGLRASEVASLHISQFQQPVGEGAIPYIQLGPMVGRYQDQVVVFELGSWGFDVDTIGTLPRRQFDNSLAKDDVPYILFDSRKNGPGEVSILFGLDYLDGRIIELADPDWNGYLFPSPYSDTPHITRNTVRNRFQRLASKADLPNSIQGERPSPQLCRRFWYDSYSASLDGVLEGIEEIAAEQGSSDPQVVMRNYLSDSRSRKLRREFMCEQLESAFSSTD